MTPALTFPIRQPANGAATIMLMGQAENNKPVSDSLNPYPFSKKNGMDTMASICAVNEAMLVSTDKLKSGIRIRSTGSNGYSKLS